MLCSPLGVKEGDITVSSVMPCWRHNEDFILEKECTHFVRLVNGMINGPNELSIYQKRILKNPYL
jgi:hypothetical protein